MHQVLIVSNFNIINNHLDQWTLSSSNSKNDYSLCPLSQIMLYLYILNCTDKIHWLFPMTPAKMSSNYSVCHHIHVLHDERCHNNVCWNRTSASYLSMLCIIFVLIYSRMYIYEGHIYFMHFHSVIRKQIIHLHSYDQSVGYTLSRWSL